MLTFVPRTSARQVIQPTGNIGVTSSTGANATLASFSIPAGTMQANSQIVMYLDLTATVSGAGQQVNITITDGSSTTTLLNGLVNSTTTCRAMIRIANRNSTSAQYCAIENVINFTVAGTPQNTTAKALAGAFTLNVTATNSAGDITLQSILVEIIP